MGFHSLTYRAETDGDIHCKIVFVGNVRLGASILINCIGIRFTGFHVSDIRGKVNKKINVKYISKRLMFTGISQDCSTLFIILFY